MNITIVPNDQLREVLKYIDEHNKDGEYAIKIKDSYRDYYKREWLKEWEFYLTERGYDARKIDLINTQFIPLLKGLFIHGTQKIEVEDIDSTWLEWWGNCINIILSMKEEEDEQK